MAILPIAETARSSPEGSKRALSRCYFSRAFEVPAIHANDMYPQLEDMLVISKLPRAAMQ
jgi:hypothetical protein